MKKSIIFISLISLVGLTSCKKDLLDINHNPNTATTSTPQLTTPAALESTARIVSNSYNNYNFWTGFWSGSASFAKPAATYSYDITNSYQASTWDNLYNNLADIDYVEKQAVANNLPFYNALAKVLKAVDYQQIVDQWGNAAYTEAQQGSDNFSPKYDDQQFIYEDIVKKLDTAIGIFDNYEGTKQTFILNTEKKRVILYNDILDPDDPATIADFLKQWSRFARSVKLKILMQQSQIPGRDAYITSNLSGLSSDDFLQVGEDAAVNPGYDQSAFSKVSPLFGSFYKSLTSAADNYNSIKANAAGISWYLGVNDPRISYYYLRSGATYQGSILGDPIGNLSAASIGKGLLDPVRPAAIMTAAEALFLQAEAVQRNYMAGDAKALYEAAVAASFHFDALSTGFETLDGQEGAYLAQANANVNWDLAPDKIELIITQKALALNGLSNLAIYDDYRRTGFPAAPLSTDINSKGKVPLRMFYPQGEVLYNNASVLAQGNIDVFNTPIFWDK